MNNIFRKLGYLKSTRGSVYKFDSERFLKLEQQAFSLGFRLYGYGSNEFTLCPRDGGNSGKAVFNSMDDLEIYLKALV